MCPNIYTRRIFHSFPQWLWHPQDPDPSDLQTIMEAFGDEEEEETEKIGTDYKDDELQRRLKVGG